MRKNTITFTLALVLVASCSLFGPSKYAPYSNTLQQGYQETPLDSTTWRVTFSGNPGTSYDIVDRYALYRCAELTSQHGYDYFVVQSEQAEKTIDVSTEHGVASRTVVDSSKHPVTGQEQNSYTGRTRSGQYVTASQSHAVTKTIRMFLGQRPGDNPNAYDAKSMLSVMAPSIERGD